MKKKLVWHDEINSSFEYSRSIYRIVLGPTGWKLLVEIGSPCPTCGTSIFCDLICIRTFKTREGAKAVIEKIEQEGIKI